MTTLPPSRGKPNGLFDAQPGGEKHSIPAARAPQYTALSRRINSSAGWTASGAAA